MWAIAPLVGTGAAISAHADVWATLRIFLAGFLPLIILIASFVRSESYWKLTTFDFLCGLFSLLAFVVWTGVNMPSLAVALAAVGDGFAALPTIIKAWKHPETETGSTFIASLASTLLVIPSIPNWQLENWVFQAYLLVVNTFLIVAIYRKRFQTVSSLKV